MKTNDSKKIEGSFATQSNPSFHWVTLSKISYIVTFEAGLSTWPVYIAHGISVPLHTRGNDFFKNVKTLFIVYMCIFQCELYILEYSYQLNSEVVIRSL